MSLQPFVIQCIYSFNNFLKFLAGKINVVIVVDYNGIFGWKKFEMGIAEFGNQLIVNMLGLFVGVFYGHPSKRFEKSGLSKMNSICFMPMQSFTISGISVIDFA